MSPRLGSLFAGIGGFDLAAKTVGIDTAFTSEFDAACNRVLDVHFNGAAHLGDITTIDGTLLPAVDVLTAGSPCQDFSIAGMRRGLGGERSGLFAHFVRLIDEMRPRFALWENVPGALTSSKGEDFANVLGALVGSLVPLPLPKHPSGRRSRYAGVAHGPKGTLAWRVLDAQHFGVAQRRQRIIAVLDTQGWDSVRILFPDSPTEAWQYQRIDVMRGNCWAVCLDTDDVPFDTGMAPPVPKKVRLAEILQQDVDSSYDLSERACRGILGRSAGYTLPEVVEAALIAQAGDGVPYRLLQAVPAEHLPVLLKMRHGKPGGGKGPLPSVDLSLTLATGNDQVLFQPAYGLHGTQAPITLVDTALTLESNNAPYSGVVCDPPTYRVRRLTEVECERLQGFPDGWTDVEGHQHRERYKQLGNAVAVPVAEWVLGNIAEVLR